jgi:hypothetical protein
MRRVFVTPLATSPPSRAGPLAATAPLEANRQPIAVIPPVRQASPAAPLQSLTPVAASAPARPVPASSEAPRAASPSAAAKAAPSPATRQPVANAPAAVATASDPRDAKTRAASRRWVAEGRAIEAKLPGPDEDQRSEGPIEPTFVAPREIQVRWRPRVEAWVTS